METSDKEKVNQQEYKNNTQEQMMGRNFLHSTDFFNKITSTELEKALLIERHRHLSREKEQPEQG